MIDWVSAIAEADEMEIHDVLVLVLDRYRQLYPHGEMRTFWVDYGRNIYEQIDSTITMMEAMKKRIGPVLLEHTNEGRDCVPVPRKAMPKPKEAGQGSKIVERKVIEWKKK